MKYTCSKFTAVGHNLMLL